MWTVYQTCVLLLFFVRPVLSTPSLNITGPTVVTLMEKETARTELMTGIVCVDDDGDMTRAFKRAISPNTVCKDCFQVWPCSTGPDYCLVFNPGMGTLNYDVVSTYVIQIECTDDVTSSIKNVEVRLINNSPPTFVVPAQNYVPVITKNTESRKAGNSIYDANADDVDGDAVFFTMDTFPSAESSLFEIGYSDGVIRATKDLRFMCTDNVDFSITITDTFNAAVGPAIVDMTFTTGNVKGQWGSTQKDVNIPEDPYTTAPKFTSVNVGIQPLIINDDTVYSRTWDLRAIPEEGLQYYYLTIVGGKAYIKTRTRLDYEYAPLRDVVLCVDSNDGFCPMDQYCFTVHITDVPEPPIIVPDSLERSVYEGFITLDPGWKVFDPDEGEKHTWVMTKNGGNAFHVDQDNGVIYSTGEYDVDTKTVKQVRTLEVEVTDKDGKKDTATIKVTIYDKNDNAPYFVARLYQFTASPCTKTGALIGKIFAKDDDSYYQGNDQLVYSGAGANITVLSTGDVTLMQQCTVGQSESIKGLVTDQGTYPGPLEGVPCTIEFTCNECPVPVTGNPPITTPTTTVPPDLTNRSNFWKGNMGWIIPAAILGVVLLAALTYLLYRCCRETCARYRRMRTLRAKSPKPNRIQPKPAKDQKPKLAEKKRQLTPPAPPPPDNEPFLFGFWKETFPDRDQRHNPKRAALPASVAQDRKVEEKEREEEMKEVEQRRKERQKVEEEYQREMDRYHHQLIDINGPAGQSANKRPPTPAKKKGPCTIL